MKTLTLLIALIVVMSWVGISAAETSAAFAVTCSIPIMPGINAPLIEEQEVKEPPKEELKNEAEVQEGIMEAAPAETEEKIEEEKLSGEQEQPIVMVKTVYSR